MKTAWWEGKKCPVCGEMFVPAPLHAWKIDEGYYKEREVCTYHCMRAWERKEAEKGERKAKRRRVTKATETQLQGV